MLLTLKMNKNQLTAVLKINGYDLHSTDDDIRAVLLGAKYTESEVEKALVILRQTNVANVVRADGLHTVFYTDTHLKPSEISGLLGIEVDLDFNNTHIGRDRGVGFSFIEVLIIVTFSMLVAVVGSFLYMYLNEVGLYHSLR